MYPTLTRPHRVDQPKAFSTSNQSSGASLASTSFTHVPPRADMPSVDDLIEVRSSVVHGTGAFARRALPRRSVLGIYEGRRYPAGHALETDADCELTYLFGLSNGATIDGSQGGNATRYLNHSCSPNCEAIEQAMDGELRVRIVTRRAISAGAELFIDYGLVVEATDDGAYLCQCQARRCRGTMVASPPA
jgi:uncharacterized protein